MKSHPTHAVGGGSPSGLARVLRWNLEPLPYINNTYALQQEVSRLRTYEGFAVKTDASQSRHIFGKLL